MIALILIGVSLAVVFCRVASGQAWVTCGFAVVTLAAIPAALAGVIDWWERHPRAAHNLRWLARETLRFGACLLVALMWFALLLLMAPDAGGAPVSLSTRDCGPMAPRKGGASPSTEKPRHAKGGAILARVTVYAPDEPGGDYWTRRGRSATGVRLRQGHCAVDPGRIPYGSIVIVGGRRLLAVDRGAFRGWHVDVFFQRWTDAVRFDRETPDHAPVTVIRPKS